MSNPVHGPDTRAIPFRGAQPFGMLPDLVVGGALDLAADEQLWVPQAPGVTFRPLLLPSARDIS